ncbi:MAG: hypothetical protein HON14_01340 [Rhodospirillaceae bacterium]|nr:hypothetical protein [Rhodospirillaceae bacterium]
MPLEAFSPSATLVGTLTGGVTSIDRTLINQSGRAQTLAARSVQKLFASRIDAALIDLGRSNSTAISEQLLRDQSHLISRKERVNQAVGVLNQALDQFDYLKNHIEYLEEQIAAHEAGDITGAELSADWDNKLRKINQLASAASESIKDGSSYYQKNLIETRSRSSFSTQTLFAPYNSAGDTLQIDGVYLGTDYYITEDTSGDFWNSDTGYAESEDAVGTLTEYTSYPDTPTGLSDRVTDLTLNFYTVSTGAISFELPGTGTITGTVTEGGLGLLDAWIYSDFDNTDPNYATSLQQAKDDLEAVEGLILTTEAEFLHDRATLQSRVSVFDSLITGINSEVANLVEDIQDEARADLLATQLEFILAQFDFALLAARGNSLVQSILISQDEEDFGTNTNAGRVLISVGQTVNITA